MFQLDDNFLNQIGLGEMPPDQRSAFLSHMQEELELRVGARMSEGLSPDQIAEFERIIDGDEQTISAVLAAAGDASADPIYQRLVARAGFTEGSPELAAEYASIKWLTKNRPDYQEIVAAISQELKNEIIQGREKILS